MNLRVEDVSEAALAAGVAEAMAPEFEPLEAPDELERHAGIFRRAAEGFSRKKADARRAGKAELAALRTERKERLRRRADEIAALADRFEADKADLIADCDADLAALDAREAGIRAETEEAVAVNERLCAASRAALAEIEAE